MLIQEFCRATGLTRDTVRFYVRQGLLAPTIGAPARGASAGAPQSAGPSGPPSNRYQVFDAGQVERARLIRAAQGLGFSLREIAALAAAYEAGGLTTARKADILRAHLTELDTRAARLATVRGYLAAKLAWVEAGEVGSPPRLDAADAPTTGTARRDGVTRPSGSDEVRGCAPELDTERMLGSTRATGPMTPRSTAAVRRGAAGARRR